VGAVWCSANKIIEDKLKLRSVNEIYWIDYVEGGGEIHSLDILKY